MDPIIANSLSNSSPKLPEQPNPDAFILQSFSAGAKFPLGSIVITPTAAEVVSPSEVHAALARHVRGDWGNLGKNDWNENDLSLTIECRLLSAYTTQRSEKFWIITEADRSSTCILLPSDY